MESNAEELQTMLAEQGKILTLSNISDAVRRDCALMILQSIMDFLKSSSSMYRVADRTIREGLALVLSVLGPGDPHLFTLVLETIQHTTSTAGRQQLLDILPYCVPMEENEREGTTEKILLVFKDMLLKDASSLLPIIGSLSSIPLSDKGRQEAWKLALVSLSAVKNDLPVIIQSLIANVTTRTDAQEALLVIRDIEGDSDDDQLIANLILGNLQRRNGRILCESYMEILQTIASSSHKEDDEFVLLDVVLLLALYQRGLFKSKVESLMDLLLHTAKFPFEVLLALISSLMPRQRTLIQERIQPALLEIGLFLLLAPVRIAPHFCTLMERVQDYFLALHHRLHRTYQEELVRSLLHLGDEASLTSITTTSKKSQGLRVTCNAVHHILMALGKAEGSSLLRCKYMLMERLTCEKQSIGHAQVSAILVTLLDTGLGGGLDSTELMILLQKLLFSPSLSRNEASHQINLMKVARGVTLAGCMIQSVSLSTSDKDCIYQWVLTVLLPSNRRTVQPGVGSAGLSFLSRWAEQPQGGQAQVFQHIKMIMANTGLVQMKEAYLQRKRTGVHLAYKDIPKFFSRSSATNGSKKKRRDLLFCVQTFLQYRGLPEPAGWRSEATWIFHLVNTYLQEGRKDGTGGKRTKWLPDGWLEAALELPIFLESGGNNTNDALSTIFQNFAIGEIYHLKGKDTRLGRSSLNQYDDFLTRKLYIENLHRSTLSLLLGLSLSLAVVKNSYYHLVSLEECDESAGNFLRNAEVLRLLKYQLLKVYDLWRRLEILLNRVDAVHSILKRYAKKQDTNSELDRQHKQLGEASTQGRAILSSLLQTPSFLDFRVVKRCLIDKKDNLRLLQSTISESIDTSEIEYLILFRRQAMEHAVSRYFTSKAHEGMMDEELVLHSSAFVSSLTNLKMSSGRKPNVSLPISSSRDELLSPYFEFIVCVIDHVVQQQEKGNRDAIDLLRCMLHSNRKINVDRSMLVRDLVNRFLTDLRSTTDATVAIQLAEIIALIAQLDPLRQSKIALDACWRMLHTIYPSKSTSDQNRSPTFIRTSTKYLHADSTIRKVLRSSLVQCSHSQLKESCLQPMIRRSLLLLWSLLVEASHQESSTIMASLIDELDTCFREQKNIPPITAREEKPSKKSRTHVNLPTIASLNGGTLPIYVELTLQMIIATFAIQEPAKCGSDTGGPYSHLTAFEKLFERVLILVENNLSLLPQRFASLLVKSCHQLLEVVVGKARQCVEWRIRQPLLTAAEKEAGKIDQGSIEYLQDLLQSITAVGLVSAFCQRSCIGDGSFGCSNSKVTALLRSTKRAASLLQEIAIAHNIVQTSHQQYQENNPVQKNEFRKSNVKGYHVESDDDQPTLVSKRKKRVVPTLVSQDVELEREMQMEFFEEETEWQQIQEDDETGSQSSQMSEDEFGVSGDWGSDESDAESNSSASLELGGGLIAVAV